MNRKVFNSRMIGLGIGATAFALALTSGVALAGNPGGRGHFGRGIRAAMATLDLSDAQKEKVTGHLHVAPRTVPRLPDSGEGEP